MTYVLWQPVLYLLGHVLFEACLSRRATMLQTWHAGVGFGAARGAPCRARLPDRRFPICPHENLGSWSHVESIGGMRCVTPGAVQSTLRLSRAKVEKKDDSTGAYLR